MAFIIKGTNIVGGGGEQVVSKHNYSTTEQVVGTWIDGKPIYEIVNTYVTPKTINTTGWTDTGIYIASIEKVINSFALDNNNQYFPLAIGLYGDGRVAGALATGVGTTSRTIQVIVIQYTKSTDAPASIL